MPKITELPAGSALAGTEPTAAVQGGATVQVPASYYTTLALAGFSANGLSLGAAANYAAMRTLLDLEAGTDFNAYTANLAGLSAQASTGLVNRTGAGTYTTNELDTDGTLAANSDTKVASQKAVKTYVDAAVGSGGTVTHTAGALTLNQLVFGNGTADLKVGNLTGDVTTSGGTATTIANDAVVTAKILNSNVTLAKLANIADQTILGNNTGGAAAPVALTASQVRTVAGLGTSATVNTGTSGATIPLLNGANTHSGLSTFSAGGLITPQATPATNEIGYLGAPVLTGLDSGNVAPALTDCGKTFYHTDANARNFTIPANGSVAFPVGTILVVENENGAANVSIIITTDTLRWGSSTGTRTLAANGGCAIQKVASTVWRIRGEGIT